MIMFAIERHHHPLLLVEVKAPLEFKLDSERNAAIVAVIQHLDEVEPNNLNQCTEGLYVISAIGKRWRACCTSKGKGGEDGQPVNAVAKANSLRSAIVACWNLDHIGRLLWKLFGASLRQLKGMLLTLLSSEQVVQVRY